MVVLATCGKDSPTTPNTPAPPPPAVPAATRILIAPPSPILNAIGHSVRLSATVFDQNGTPINDAVVTWSSGNSGVATVSTEGLVKAADNGIAVITARSGSVSASNRVTVKQLVGSIGISPEAATLMSIGDSVQLSVEALDQNGHPVEDAAVSWTSGDETVVTVSAQGLVTAVNNGTTRITARSGSAFRNIDVTVMQSAVSIAIASVDEKPLSIGDSVQLSVEVLDQNGHPVEDAVVSWTSDDETVATVSAQGLVTAVGSGMARITARAGSATDGIDLTVREPSPDREVLIALYESMGGRDWTNNANWLSEKHVEAWYGVNTDAEGRVTSLNLGNNGLKGQLPEALSGLSRLEGLALENNSLTGSIPPELGKLGRLTLLYLFDNKLTGSIPADLGQLVNLIHLCLNGNLLTGSIPPELGGLEYLKWLHLHGNYDLSGAIPDALTALELDALLLQGTRVCLSNDTGLRNWVSKIQDARIVECEGFDPERNALEALFMATNGPNWERGKANWMSDAPLGTWSGVRTDADGKVISLMLSSSGLSGTIPPELGQLSNLVRLDLSGNQLTGLIPAEIGRLIHLERLTLQRNLLTGPIPSDLGRLANLIELRLSSNRLAGSIPAELGQLTGLTDLYISGNQLTGSIPPELGRLTDLRHLWLQDNKLSGEIPPELGQLADLVELNLGSNQLSGRIPPESGRLAGLRRLWLQQNSLSGEIPPELGQLAKMIEMYLGSNQLSGNVPPELGQLAQLEVMSFSNNQITGGIPSELGRLNNLKNLILSWNNLTGSIPAALGRLSSLEFLWIHSNGLTGSIPSGLGGLANLRSLLLRDNQLEGNIPAEFGQLINLTWLDVRNNTSLSGPLPPEITALGALRGLLSSGTQLCIPAIDEYQEWLSMLSRKEIGICELESVDQDPLVVLYHATGGENWTDNTNWTSNLPLDDWYGVATTESGRVVALNLAGNNLVGRIPRDVSRLSHLRVLDLSGNPSIEDPLPSELTRLALETLRLDETRSCVPRDDEFQGWLAGISVKSGITNCEALMADGDRSVLIDFFESAHGQGWTQKTGWLSERPLGEWHGVTVDGEGRVTELILARNNLTGSISARLAELEHLSRLELRGNELAGIIPSELGRLNSLGTLNLSSNRLTGGIPAELGELTNLRSLNLGSNRLTGGIPPGLGNLKNLTEFRLNSNELTGGIPPGLGGLSNLAWMQLSNNNLTGEIPPELGKLKNLRDLDIGINSLSGGIPKELAELTELEGLNLSSCELTGSIPAELGGLSNLRRLYLSSNRMSGSLPGELGDLSNLEIALIVYNQLSGSIPPELGRLSRLESLELFGNQLTGSIPAELGQLASLVNLNLFENRLTGSIPAELGQLANLRNLNLSDNRLTDMIPPEFGNLGSLESLILNGNAGLTGQVPVSLIRLGLDTLLLDGTQLCMPMDDEFRQWFTGIANRSRIESCRTNMNKQVYLSQAVQSFVRPVPLVEGESALLRVFLTTEEGVLNKPPMKASFFVDGNEEYSVDIPAGPSKIPMETYEGSLDESSNAMVPGRVIRPGLELEVEINPGGPKDSESNLVDRIPDTGRLSIDVQSVPGLHLTLVPILSLENPDDGILSATEGLTADDAVFRKIRDLLPVPDQDFELNVREEILTNEEVHPNNESLLLELAAIRAMDGADGHYMGIVDLDESSGGIADLSGFTSLSTLVAGVMAHELGHNLSLEHAPCGNVRDFIDPQYPYENGSIGAWGYDLQTGALKHPSIPDIMGYCFEGAWISDYHFKKAIDYRVHEEEPVLAAASFSQSKSLLLWGGVDGSGQLSLEPVFVVDAPVYMPREDGPYRLVGVSADGGILFTSSFAMKEIADGDGGSRFAFLIPARSDWAGMLARVTLSGPEGFAVMTRDSGRSAAILLDRFSGTVRGILRDWPQPGTTIQGARRVSPDPSLEVVFSPGIPDVADWRR